MTTDRTYDDLAELFHELGHHKMDLEDFAKAAAARRIDLWSIPKRTLENAMLARGITVASGTISEAVAAPFHPIVDAEFTEFQKAAARALKEAARPLSVSELIGMCGLAEQMIPMGSIEFYLRKLHAQFIDGLGWYRTGNYMDEHGRFFFKTYQSDSYAEVFRIFQEYGWPMLSSDIIALSGGKLYRTFMQDDVRRREAPNFKDVYRALFVPIGVMRPRTLPISRNVAEAVMRIGPSQKVGRSSNPRMWVVCQWLHAEGHGHVRYWKTAREGKRVVLMSFRLSEKGKAALAKAIGEAPAEEF